MEPALQALLTGLCPRVFPDTAPPTTAMPYVTWQLIGGRALGYLDRSAADKRHSMVQINVWAGTRKDCMTLMRSIEQAMRTSTTLTAWPDAEPMTDEAADLEPPRYGAMQDFQVYSQR